MAVEERADGAADGQTHAQADVAQALLDGERLAPALGPVVVGDHAAARRVGHRLAEAQRGADHHQQAEGSRSGTRPPSALMTDHGTMVTAMARVRFQRSAR